MATERPVTEFPYRFEFVPIGNLFVDKKYQRKVSERFVERMIEDWRPHLIGTLAISEREGEGTGKKRVVLRGAIVDGQTRWTAGKKKGLEVIPSCVYEGLTREEEAALFVDIQTRRRGVGSWEKFRAKLASGDTDAVELNNLVEHVGYAIGARNESDKTLAAVAALEVCFRRNDEILERGLIDMYEADWIGDRVPTAWHIRGLWRYLNDTPDVDDERLIRRIKLAGPDSIYKRALNARQGGGLGSQSEPYMAQAFRAVYTTSESKLQRAA